MENEIKKEREKLGISQKKLADEVGASRQLIAAIEKGTAVPNTSLANRIAKFNSPPSNLRDSTITDNGTTVSLSQSTASTSTTTGALTVAGGVGVAGALFVGTTLNAVVYTETKSSPTISAGTLTLLLNTANVFTVSLNANITTLSLSSLPAGTVVYSLVLQFTADGTARAVTWPASVKWPGGTAPTLTSTLNKVDTFVLMTPNSGTTYFGFVSAQNS
jgi:DNA-binding XRE family transcriptional regulator